MMELLHLFTSGAIVAQIDFLVTHVVNVRKMFALILFRNNFRRKKITLIFLRVQCVFSISFPDEIIETNFNVLKQI
jgi:hypothetical protein